MAMPTWDKSAFRKDIEGFVGHLRSLQAQGCRWLVVPLTEDEVESPRCSQCGVDAADAAPLYSIATHLAFEEEVLKALEASSSQADYESRVSRIIEEEPTPMVCKNCCPRDTPHRHDFNHAF